MDVWLAYPWGRGVFEWGGECGWRVARSASASAEAATLPFEGRPRRRIWQLHSRLSLFSLLRSLDFCVCLFLFVFQFAYRVVRLIWRCRRRAPPTWAWSAECVPGCTLHPQTTPVIRRRKPRKQVSHHEQPLPSEHTTCHSLPSTQIHTWNFRETYQYLKIPLLILNKRKKSRYYKIS